MKYLNVFFFAVIAMLMTACSGGVTPVSEKIQGPLGKYFEIVQKDYKAKDGKICIELKRIKKGFPKPWKEGMELGFLDGQYEPQFTIEFQDADGTVISKDHTDKISDEEELKAIASLEVDETATITFDCEEKVSKFKMGSTFKVNGLDNETEEQEQTLNLEGNIGQYPIMMTIHIDDDGSVTGAYYYKKNRPGNYLYLKGEKTNNRVVLNEFNANGLQTGTYEGKLENDIYKGRFNTKSGNYAFLLKPTAMKEIDFSNVDFDFFNAEYITYGDDADDDDYEDTEVETSTSSSSGSEDWDKILNSYEQYTNKLISYSEKISKGDMTVLADYPALMEKAQEFSDKLSKAKGNMSASQWKRYMQITTKMLEAVEKSNEKHRH